MVVPNERVAHALRRALIERGAASALIGTSFLSLPELAARVLHDAGEMSAPSELELDASLAREALARVELAHFERTTMLALPGWDDAFARTLRELEAAELPLHALLASDDAEVRDVARVFEEWQTLEHLDGPPALLARATALLQRGRSWQGSTLAMVTGFESVREARLLCALPNVRWAVWGVHAPTPALLARLAALYGEDLARTLAASRPASSDAGALARLQSEPLAAAGTTGAVGAVASGTLSDGSLAIALYPGLHEEVEAAVGWVVEQVVEHRLPLQEIALLAPVPDLYASTLRQRLQALPWPGAQQPVWVEGGERVVERGDGARLLQTIRALRDGLSREALTFLLPALRGRAQVPPVRGVSRARALLRAVAIAGGTRARLQGGRAWPEAWENAVLALELAPAARSDRAERAHRRELQLALAGLAPAIEGLTDVLRSVIAGEPLSLLWTRLSAFSQACLRVPPAEPPVWSLLDHAVARFEGHEEHEPLGVAALEWLERALCELRVPPAPYGGPCVYIGSLASVRGLSFRAVRVLGLVEGAWGRATRPDPVLCDRARAALSPVLLTSELRAERELAAWCTALAVARERLVLSAPHRSANGRARPPAAVLYAAVRALTAGGPGSARTAGAQGELEALAQREVARERDARERLAIGRAAQLARSARGDRALAQAQGMEAAVFSDPGPDAARSAQGATGRGVRGTSRSPALSGGGRP